MASEMAERLRVLLIAEAANPEFVSVPLVGWSIANALGELNDVHIVTQIRNREAFLRAGLIEGIDFTAIDSERVARPLWKLSELLRMGKGRGWTTVQAVNSLSYAYFESLVSKRFGSDIQRGSFDIVHRITPLSPTQASAIAPRCHSAGIPFVLGPLNGGVPWPKGFSTERRREREWLSYLRNAYKLLPGPRRTMASASAILVGSLHTGSEVPVEYEDRVIYLPENGIDPDRFSRAASPGSTKGPLRACFVGRMVPYKGPDMLIAAAVPLLRDGRLNLEMIGDGPLLSELEDLVKSEKIGDTVRFHGWVEHQRVQDVLVGCDLFVFPSVREFGGGVVLEAMALGVPPIVVDYGGPGELVHPGMGFKIPIGSREAIIAGVRSRLTDLADHRDELSEIGAHARSWVEENFTWKRKAEQISRVYKWVLEGAGKAPSLF